MSEGRTAAIFDFDGLIFQKGTAWKGKDARVAPMGGRVQPKKALEVFDQILLRYPDALLQNYFEIDEFTLDAFHPDVDINVVPKNQVRKTARSHRTRGHDLYLLSAKGEYPGLSDFVKKIDLPDEFRTETPFEWASLVYPKAYGIQTSLSPMEQKISLLSELLLNEFSLLERENAPRKYKQIFLYHTELDYIDALKKFLGENRETLLGGRNAVLPMRIVDEV